MGRAVTPGFVSVPRPIVYETFEFHDSAVKRFVFNIVFFFLRILCANIYVCKNILVLLHNILFLFSHYLYLTKHSIYIWFRNKKNLFTKNAVGVTILFFIIVDVTQNFLNGCFAIYQYRNRTSSIQTISRKGVDLPGQFSKKVRLRESWRETKPAAT